MASMPFLSCEFLLRKNSWMYHSRHPGRPNGAFPAESAIIFRNVKLLVGHQQFRIQKTGQISCLHEPIKVSTGEKLLSSSSTGQQFPVEGGILLAVLAYQRRGYRRKNGESERGPCFCVGRGRVV
jgi:hypothetical protein